MSTNIITDRETRLVSELRLTLKSKGWTPGSMNGWDEGDVDAWFRALIRAGLKQKSLPLAVASADADGRGRGCSVNTTATKHDWLRVTRSEPCIVCGKMKYCGRTTDGALIRCMNSDDTPAGYKFIRQNPDGGRLFGALDDRPPLPPRPKRKPAPKVDWQARWQQARDEVIPGELYDYSDAMLGLSGEGLDLLDAGFIDDELVTPERDAKGGIIGLVKRTHDGRKISMTGSKRGLTYQHPLPEADPVLIVEGASDVAAAIEAGCTAVGRPSNVGGGDLLAELLRGRDVIVVGENDRKADGSWPGRDGAERIAAQLRGACSSVRVVYPPDTTKDIRSWLRGDA